MLDIKSLGNPNKIIFGVIVFLVIFAAIYVYHNRKRATAGAKQQIEGFTQYKVEGADSVALGGYDNVFIGTQALHLDAAIMDVVKSPANKNELLAGYVRSSELDPTTVLKDIGDLKTSITNINNPTGGILAQCQNKIGQSTGALDTRISTIEGKIGPMDIQNEIQRLTTALDSAAPPLSIVAYYGDEAPPGWQICNGDPLIGMDGVLVVYSSSLPVYTPKLSGRVIVGAGKDKNGADIQSLQDNINSRNLTMQRVGDYGGEEQHKLTLAEMPAHSHKTIEDVNSANLTIRDGVNPHSCLGDGSKHYSGGGGDNVGLGGNCYRTDNIGGDSTLSQLQNPNYPNDATKKINATASHNIMQPYFVLMYIIKQPKNGGTITKPFANISATSSPQAKFIRF